jgi:hypothetical protein
MVALGASFLIAWATRHWRSQSPRTCPRRLSPQTLTGPAGRFHSDLDLARTRLEFFGIRYQTQHLGGVSKTTDAPHAHGLFPLLKKLTVRASRSNFPERHAPGAHAIIENFCAQLPFMQKDFHDLRT